MQLEVGNYYKNANGDKVKIIWNDRDEDLKDSNFPWLGVSKNSATAWYNDSGRGITTGVSMLVADWQGEPKKKIKRWLWTDARGDNLSCYLSETEAAQYNEESGAEAYTVKLPFSEMELEE